MISHEQRLRLLTDETRCSRRIFVIDSYILSTINSTVCQTSRRQQTVTKDAVGDKKSAKIAIETAK